MAVIKYKDKKTGKFVTIPLSGSGSSGGTGIDGKSAYEIALDNGFEGTEEEWLESLKGADGEKGRDGTNGEDGLTPFIGTNGNWWIGTNDTGVCAKGKDGEQGEKGESGTDGVSATHSWNGTVLTISSASGTNSVDLKGDKGDDGINGENGYTPQKGVDYFTEEDKAEIKGTVETDIWHNFYYNNGTYELPVLGDIKRFANKEEFEAWRLAETDLANTVYAGCQNTLFIIGNKPEYIWDGQKQEYVQLSLGERETIYIGLDGYCYSSAFEPEGVPYSIDNLGINCKEDLGKYNFMLFCEPIIPYFTCVPLIPCWEDTGAVLMFTATLCVGDTALDHLAIYGYKPWDDEALSFSIINMAGEYITSYYGQLSVDKEALLGDVESALDAIIAIQNSLIGGESV